MSDIFYKGLEAELHLCYEENLERLKDRLAWPSFLVGWGAFILIWWFSNGH